MMKTVHRPLMVLIKVNISNKYIYNRTVDWCGIRVRNKSNLSPLIKIVLLYLFLILKRQLSIKIILINL